VPVPASGIDTCWRSPPGRSSRCARRDEGTIWCWGDNHSGQLAPAPRPATDARRRRHGHRRNAVAPRQPHLRHRRRRDGGKPQVLCWGADEAGQLGDNHTAIRATPAALKLPLDADRSPPARSTPARAPPTDRSSAGGAAS